MVVSAKFRDRLQAKRVEKVVALVGILRRR